MNSFCPASSSSSSSSSTAGGHASFNLPSQHDLPSFISDLLLAAATSLADHVPRPTVIPRPSETAAHGAAPSSASSRSSSTREASRADGRPAEERPGAGAGSIRQPPLDLFSTPDSPNLTAIIELPGFSKADVTLAVRRERLVVSAGPGQGQADGASAATWRVRERPASKTVRWIRELPLAAGVKPEEIKASMADGILTITYPKESRPDDQSILTVPIA